jgi:hypothetical protein
MRAFNYSKIKEQKWDSEILGYIAAIYKEAGKQELYLKQRPEELERLVEIAKVQSTEASNAIEGIVTTSTRIKQLVEEKTTPRNRDEQEIAGYRDVLNLIHENFDVIPITQNYILQLHSSNIFWEPFSLHTAILKSALPSWKQNFPPLKLFGMPRRTRSDALPSRISGNSALR